MAGDVAILILAFAVALGSPAQPSLPWLHVRAFTMSVDRADVRVGEPFHVSIEARLDERIGELDGILLPNLAAFEQLGDERRCAWAGHGTVCTETLSLDALAPGDAEIEPAALDAIDARNERPSQFRTNSLVVHVSGDPMGTVARRLAGVLVAVAGRIVGLLALVALGAVALAWLRARTRGRVLVPAAAPPAAPVASEPRAPDPDARWQGLVAALAREPTRPRAVAVRAALRERVGAGEHETLADLAERGACGNGRDAAALAALERAAFCKDDQLPEAVREALPYLP